MIFISSYAYVSARHIRVFDFFKKKDDLVFILPKVWKMKGGKVVLRAPEKPDLEIIPVPAHFFHSRHFLVAGLLKGWMPALWSILRRRARRGDVLYTVSEPNLLVTLFNGYIAKQFGMKHVFFTWQNVPYEQRLSGLKLKFTEWLLRKNIAASSGSICGNKKAHDILLSYAPDGFPIVTSPISGVDTEQFNPIIRTDFREKHNLQRSIVLTFVGALDARKGIKTLLRAFTSASKKEPRLHLVMAGAGPLDEFVERFVDQHELGNKVTRLPWVANEELPEMLCGSDIFLYPSEPYGGWEEQFGYSIAEASACGLPVVSTRSGSISEKVTDGVTGYLIRPGSQEELEEAILVLAGDTDLRKRMGKAGRQLIVEHFSHGVVAGKLEGLLRSL